MDRNKLILALLLLLPSAGLFAQHGSPPVIPRRFAEFTVASLPAASTTNGQSFIVTDSLTQGSCTTGGGTYKTWCRSNGTAYEPVVGGAGGGVSSDLSNLAATTAINASLAPGADNFISVGSVTKRFQNLYAFKLLLYGSTSGSCELTATAIGNGVVNTCTGGAAPQNLPAIADPGSPFDGDDWYSSTTPNRRKFRAGTTTQVYAWLSDIPGAIANVTTTTATTTVNANSCDAAATTVTMAGVTTSMTFNFTPTSDTSAVTGWGASGGLVIVAWPTANTVNYKRCNQTSSNITPGAVTFNISAR